MHRRHPEPVIRTAAFLILALATFLAPARAAEVEEPAFISADAAVQYYVLAGELAAQRQQPLLAAKYYLKVLEREPEATLAMRATALALIGKDEKLALVTARIWQQQAPEDGEARQALMRLALRNGVEVDARLQARHLIKNHPEGIAAGFGQVAQLLSHEDAHKAEALALMALLRGEAADSAGAWYAEALLAMRFDELELAERSVNQSLEIDEGSSDALMLLTGIRLKRKNFDGADEAFARLVRVHEEPAAMHAGYARMLLEDERVEEARRHYMQALDIDPDLSEARFALALLSLEREDLEAAEGQLRVLLDDDNLKEPAAYYLGRIEETRRNYPEALAWYEKVTEGETALDAITRRAAVLARSGKLDEGRKLMQQMREQLPHMAIRFYLAEGDILLQAGEAKESLALYETALKENPDDPDLLYGRSLVHEHLDQFKLAEADLRNILEQNEDDARAMNALGYMLTVRNKRLKEARKLIVRALELTPDDAAVIDSMGWIEFRLGKLEEARNFLERAFDKAKDPEIAAHLGEVLWKLGHRERAREILEAALDRDPDHEVLKETFERLTR